MFPAIARNKLYLLNFNNNFRNIPGITVVRALCIEVRALCIDTHIIGVCSP